MVPVFVKLSASLRQRVPQYDPLTGLQVEVKPGERVADLLAGLGLAERDVKIIMVNGVAVSPQQTLQGGERVALFPAVGGG